MSLDDVAGNAPGLALNRVEDAARPASADAGLEDVLRVVLRDQLLHLLLIEGAGLLGLRHLLPEVVSDVLRADLVQRLGLGRRADVALGIRLADLELLTLNDDGLHLVFSIWCAGGAMV